MRSTIAFFASLWFVLWIGTPAALSALGAAHTGLLKRVNEIRGGDHLTPLAYSDSLAAVAEAHARDMARSGFLDHINRQGLSPLDRVQAAGISGFHLLAENIGVSDAASRRTEAILEAWLESPVHRENLFNPAFNTTGVGFAQGRSGQTFVVQLFATF